MTHPAIRPNSIPAIPNAIASLFMVSEALSFQLSAFSGQKGPPEGCTLIADG
jgi:hypothetical protein